MDTGKVKDRLKVFAYCVKLCNDIVAICREKNLNELEDISKDLRVIRDKIEK